MQRVDPRKLADCVEVVEGEDFTPEAFQNPKSGSHIFHSTESKIPGVQEKKTKETKEIGTQIDEDKYSKKVKSIHEILPDHEREQMRELEDTEEMKRSLSMMEKLDIENISKSIGNGSYGCLYRCKIPVQTGESGKVHPHNFVIKFPFLTPDDVEVSETSSKIVNMTEEEVQNLHKKLRELHWSREGLISLDEQHHNLVPILLHKSDYFESDQLIQEAVGQDGTVDVSRFILMKEYRLTLQEYLERRKRGDAGKDLKSLQPSEICLMLKAILKGAKFLHDHGMVHRDLHMENIFMINEPGFSRLLIGDYGLCLRFDGEDFKVRNNDDSNFVTLMGEISSFILKSNKVGGCESVMPPEFRNIDLNDRKSVLDYSKYDLYGIGKIAEVFLSMSAKYDPHQILDQLSEIAAGLADDNIKTRIGFGDALKRINKLLHKLGVDSTTKIRRDSVSAQNNAKMLERSKMDFIGKELEERLAGAGHLTQNEDKERVRGKVHLKPGTMSFRGIEELVVERTIRDDTLEVECGSIRIEDLARLYFNHIFMKAERVYISSRALIEVKSMIVLARSLVIGGKDVKVTEVTEGGGVFFLSGGFFHLQSEEFLVNGKIIGITSSFSGRISERMIVGGGGLLDFEKIGINNDQKDRFCELVVKEYGKIVGKYGDFGLHQLALHGKLELENGQRIHFNGGKSRELVIDSKFFSDKCQENTLVIGTKDNPYTSVVINTEFIKASICAYAKNGIFNGKVVGDILVSSASNVLFTRKSVIKSERISLCSEEIFIENGALIRGNLIRIKGRRVSMGDSKVKRNRTRKAVIISEDCWIESASDVSIDANCHINQFVIGSRTQPCENLAINSRRRRHTNSRRMINFKIGRFIVFCERFDSQATEFECEYMFLWCNQSFVQHWCAVLYSQEVKIYSMIIHKSLTTYEEIVIDPDKARNGQEKEVTLKEFCCVYSEFSNVYSVKNKDNLDCNYGGFRITEIRGGENRCIKVGRKPRIRRSQMRGLSGLRLFSGGNLLKGLRERFLRNELWNGAGINQVLGNLESEPLELLKHLQGIKRKSDFAATEWRREILRRVSNSPKSSLQSTRSNNVPLEVFLTFHDFKFATKRGFHDLFKSRKLEICRYKNIMNTKKNKKEEDLELNQEDFTLLGLMVILENIVRDNHNEKRSSLKTRLEKEGEGERIEVGENEQ